MAAASATLVDFCVYAALMTLVWMAAPFATMTGCIVGGLVNFTVNRIWAFRAGGSYVRQGSRYAFVWATSALLNAGGVAVLLLLPAMDHFIAWLVERMPVGAAFFEGACTTSEAPNPWRARVRTSREDVSPGRRIRTDPSAAPPRARPARSPPWPRPRSP